MDARRMYDSASVVVDEGRVCPLQGAVLSVPMAADECACLPAEHKQGMLILPRELDTSSNEYHQDFHAHGIRTLLICA